jgi:hypothetical protein
MPCPCSAVSWPWEVVYLCRCLDRLIPQALHLSLLCTAWQQHCSIGTEAYRVVVLVLSSVTNFVIVLWDPSLNCNANAQTYSVKYSLTQLTQLHLVLVILGTTFDNVSNTQFKKNWENYTVKIQKSNLWYFHPYLLHGAESVLRS